MIEISRETIELRLAIPIRLHIDRVQLRASNWVCVEGWISDLSRDSIHAETTVGQANCLLTDRPDVCTALGVVPALAFGFTLHVIFTVGECTNAVTTTLIRNGTVIATLKVDIPQNSLKPLPFATPKALALTRSLFRELFKSVGTEESHRVTRHDNGLIMMTKTPLPFDNTRIGNYHTDAIEALSRPGVIGLDIGCGIRDRVFDNLVSQDIYLTPTATLITAPGEVRLPFDGETFDVIILDSVLEHVPDPIAILQEGYRLLKPGGKILGDAPFLQPLHLLPHHYFNFTPFGLKQVAGTAGLNLEYVAAEAHQRPEFTLEWLFRRIFETVSPAEAARLKSMSVDTLYKLLVQNKDLIDLPPESITEMAAGYRFHMVRPFL
jgi:hypothetical protein